MHKACTTAPTVAYSPRLTMDAAIASADSCTAACIDSTVGGVGAAPLY